MKTLPRLFLPAVCVATVTYLVGCSGLPYAMNPYRYQFNSDPSKVVCLIVKDDSSVAVTYEVKKALQDKGFNVREVNQEAPEDCTDCVRFDYAFGGWTNSSLTKASLELTRKEKGKTQTIRVSSTSDVPEGLTTGNSHEASDTMRMLVDRLFPQPIPWISE